MGLYKEYSDTRPDLTVHGAGAGGSLLIGDVKLLCDIDSSGVPELRGAAVGFGNVQPKADLEVHGRR